MKPKNSLFICFVICFLTKNFSFGLTPEEEVRIWNNATNSKREGDYSQSNHLFKNLWREFQRNSLTEMIDVGELRSELSDSIKCSYTIDFSSGNHTVVIENLEFYRDELNNELDEEMLKCLLKSYLLSPSLENIRKASEILKEEKNKSLKREYIKTNRNSHKQIFPDYYRQLIIEQMSKDGFSTEIYKYAMDVEVSFITSSSIEIVKKGLELGKNELVWRILDSAIEKDLKGDNSLGKIEKIFDKIVELCNYKERLSTKIDENDKRTVIFRFVKKVLEKSQDDQKDQERKRKFMGKLLQGYFEKGSKNYFILLKEFIEGNNEKKNFVSGINSYKRWQFVKARNFLEKVFNKKIFSEEDKDFVLKKIERGENKFNHVSSVILILLIFYLLYLIRKEIKRVKWGEL